MSAMLLCVQQDRELGRLYAEALRAEGYEVLCAYDGRSALEIVSRHQPSLVVLDVYLSRQDGFEILAEMRMRPESNALPVLLLCEGDVTDDIVSRARNFGVSGVEAAPVETDRLVARVAERIGSPEKEWTSQRRHASEGSLKEIPIPELLHGLHVDALDGVLLLDHGRKRKAIEFRGGWPISVKSNLLSECFGGYLVAQGRCTQNQLDESIKRMRTGEGLQGEILVAMDVLHAQSVTLTLQEHALEKFFEIFSWRDGQFKVRSGVHLQRGSSLGIEGHPSKLIVEGIRRYFPLKQIDRYFAVHQDAFLVPIEVQQQIAAVGLTEEEAHWLRGLDLSTSLGALLEATESIRRIVFALISIEALGVEACVDRQASVGLRVEEVSQGAEAVPTLSGAKQDGELSRGGRVAAIEDEGRRALRAETEYQRGERRLAKRDYEGALLCFGRAVENFPSEGEYHSQYGWCLYLCHPDNEVMLGEALEHCREGARLAKDREKPYLLLGRLYKAMGRVGAAKKMFTRAVQIRPRCVDAMRELRIMNRRRDKDKGVLERIFRR